MCEAVSFVDTCMKCSQDSEDNTTVLISLCKRCPACSSKTQVEVPTCCCGLATRLVWLKKMWGMACRAAVWRSTFSRGQGPKTGRGVQPGPIHSARAASNLHQTCPGQHRYCLAVFTLPRDTSKACLLGLSQHMLPATCTVSTSF